MKTNKTLIFVLLALFVTGCGGDSDEKQEKAQVIIPEHQLEALEKAKGLEKKLQESEAKRKEAMEQQGL